MCQHGRKHQQRRQSLGAKLSGRAWDSQRFAALPEAADLSFSEQQQLVACRSLLQMHNYSLCLSKSQACSHECSKGLECQRQKHFTTLSPHLLRLVPVEEASIFP